MAERNFRKYKLVDADGTIVRKGITKRLLEVREAELLREENKPNAHIRQVGHAVAEDSARAWEKKQKKGTPPGGRR